MPKFHINIHGEPVVCPAQQKCRKEDADGGVAEHFEGTKEEARAWAEEKNAQEAGVSFSGFSVVSDDGSRSEADQADKDLHGSLEEVHSGDEDSVLRKAQVSADVLLSTGDAEDKRSVEIVAESARFQAYDYNVVGMLDHAERSRELAEVIQIELDDHQERRNREFTEETEGLMDELPYVDDYEIEINDGNASVGFYIRGTGFRASSESGNFEELRESIETQLHDFDANDYFEEEYGNDPERLKGLYETEELVKLSLNDINGSNEPYETLEDKIEENQQQSFASDSVSSDVPNDDVYTNDKVHELIEDYELDHNNSEVFEQDGETFIVVEAPNHGTFQIEHSRAENGNTVGDIRQSLTRMEEFDADQEFQDIWTDGFGAHNGMSATDFYVGLKADEEYFKKRAASIREDLNRG